MGLQPDDILDLSRHPIRIRTWKIYLINNGKYVQIVIQGQVYVGQRLGLDSLGGVHHQDRAVTGGKASGYLVIEIHMSWSVNQVKNILLPVLGPIHGADSLRFDGNAPLPLQIHVVEHLRLHLPAGEKSCLLYNSVCKG